MTYISLPFIWRQNQKWIIKQVNTQRLGVRKPNVNLRLNACMVKDEPVSKHKTDLTAVCRALLGSSLTAIEHCYSQTYPRVNLYILNSVQFVLVAVSVLTIEVISGSQSSFLGLRRVANRLPKSNLGPGPCQQYQKCSDAQGLHCWGMQSLRAPEHWRARKESKKVTQPAVYISWSCTLNRKTQPS